MRRVIHQHQMRQTGERLTQRGEGVVGEDIAIDHQKWLGTQQRQCLEDAAPRFQRLTFGGIDDTHAETRAIAEVVLDLLA